MYNRFSELFHPISAGLSPALHPLLPRFCSHPKGGSAPEALIGPKLRKPAHSSAYVALIGGISSQSLLLWTLLGGIQGGRCRCRVAGSSSSRLEEPARTFPGDDPEEESQRPLQKRSAAPCLRWFNTAWRSCTFSCFYMRVKRKV